MILELSTIGSKSKSKSPKMLLSKMITISIRFKRKAVTDISLNHEIRQLVLKIFLFYCSKERRIQETKREGNSIFESFSFSCFS